MALRQSYIVFSKCFCNHVGEKNMGDFVGFPVELREVGRQGLATTTKYSFLCSKTGQPRDGPS